MQIDLSPIADISKSIEEGDYYINIVVDSGKYKEVAKKLKDLGFSRLMTIAVIDHLDEKQFEIYFVIRNEEGRKLIKVITRIPRDNPKITSLIDIFENAEIFERESWELFGVEFVGNNNLTHFLLEDWDGPPPFRKDFNWREYVKDQLEEDYYAEIK